MEVNPNEHFEFNRFNRTFMELKFIKKHEMAPGGEGFNRTFMELK